MENAMAFLPFLVWTIAAASLLLTTLLGVILAFHWFRYAFAPMISSVALAVYIAVSVTLLSGMFAALALFSNAV